LWICTANYYTADGFANGTTNGTTNGTANGTAYSTANYYTPIL
jgi:hypothetical protein